MAPQLTPFEQRHRDQARRIARHEFGHWLAAEHYGFKSRSINIIIHEHDRYTGATDFNLEQDLSSLEKVQSFARRRVIMLMCGAAAEWLTGDRVDLEKASNELTGRTGRAKQDAKSIGEMLRILRGIKHPASGELQFNSELESLSAELWAEAVLFVEKEGELITSVAKAVSARGRHLNEPFGMSENRIRDQKEVKDWYKRRVPPTI